VQRYPSNKKRKKKERKQRCKSRRIREHAFCGFTSEPSLKPGGRRKGKGKKAVPMNEGIQRKGDSSFIFSHPLYTEERRKNKPGGAKGNGGGKKSQAGLLPHNLSTPASKGGEERKGKGGDTSRTTGGGRRNGPSPWPASFWPANTPKRKEEKKKNTGASAPASAKGFRCVMARVRGGREENFALSGLAKGGVARCGRPTNLQCCRKTLHGSRLSLLRFPTWSGKKKRNQCFLLSLTCSLSVRRKKKKGRQTPFARGKKKGQG